MTIIFYCRKSLFYVGNTNRIDGIKNAENYSQQGGLTFRNPTQKATQKPLVSPLFTSIKSATQNRNPHIRKDGGGARQ
jgi:hypothetical protein